MLITLVALALQATDAEIADHVARLGHDDPAIRDAAQAELIRIGEPARPALEAALSSADPEVAARARLAIADLPASLKLRVVEWCRRWLTARKERAAQARAREIERAAEEAMLDEELRATIAARREITEHARERVLALAACVQQDAQERIAELVARLGHDDPAVRDAAQAELVRIGEPARPALEAALSSADPEVAARARIILEAIAPEVWGRPADGLRISVEVATAEVARGASPELRVRVQNIGRTPFEARVTDPTTIRELTDLLYWEAVDEEGRVYSGRQYVNRGCIVEGDRGLRLSAGETAVATFTTSRIVPIDIHGLAPHVDIRDEGVIPEDIAAHPGAYRLTVRLLGSEARSNTVVVRIAP